MKIIALLMAAAIQSAHCLAKTPNFLFIVVDDLHYTTDWEHSSPPGNELASNTILPIDVRTPYIQNMLNDGGVIIPRSYAGSPKCAPSRFGLLTGRYPARGEFAIRRTAKMSDSIYGTSVSVSTVAITGEDLEYNIHNTLKNDKVNPYYTAQVGKWQLMEVTDDCTDLRSREDAKLYEKCTHSQGMNGFDFVDAWYVTNIGGAPYSHNPEWIISSGKRAINNAIGEEKPWFLYVALTLTHTPDVIPTLRDHTIADSPKGALTDADYPSDSGMRPRSEVLEDVLSMGLDNDQAAIMWADEAIGALLAHLKEIGQYDDTFITIMSDHGTAKDTLYEQGTRIPQFVRYPPLFNKNGERNTPFIMPQDFITSNVDLSATVFKLAEVELPDGYSIDGVDYSTAVENAIYGEYDNTGFTERYADIESSHMIITPNYQYIWRAKLVYDEYKARRLVEYEYGTDLEQIYDLNEDPNQQNNLMHGDQHVMSDWLRAITCEFKDKMSSYMANEICQNKNECTYPDGGYCGRHFESLPEEMCCSAKAAMSLAMGTCERIMVAFEDPIGEHDACAAEKKTCEWIPCSQVGVCVAVGDENKNELLVADAGRREGRAPRPSREPRVRPSKPPKTARPTKAPRIKTPRPTRAIDVPLTGCAARMNEGECAKDFYGCKWESGYPLNVPDLKVNAELFDGSFVFPNEAMGYNQYWMGARFALGCIILYFAYRYFVNEVSKQCNAEETSPLLIIDVEA